MNDSSGNHYNNRGYMSVEMRLMIDSKKKRKKLLLSKKSKSKYTPKDIKKIKYT